MPLPPHLVPLAESVPFLRWFGTSRFAERQNDPTIANFMFGNPHDMPLPAYVGALRTNVEPQDKDWYAYKLNERPAAEVVAATLRARTGMPFVAEDVCMTNGGFAAIATALRVAAGPGDEVVFLSPPWFFYELLVR